MSGKDKRYNGNVRAALGETNAIKRWQEAKDDSSIHNIGDEFIWRFDI